MAANFGIKRGAQPRVQPLEIALYGLELSLLELRSAAAYYSPSSLKEAYGPAARFGWGIARELAGTYAYIFRRNVRLASNIGAMVRDVGEVFCDVYHYVKNGVSKDTAPDLYKRASHSLAAGEFAALGGASLGAKLAEHGMQNHAAQAVVGGFLGSEITTAVTFFATYLALTTITDVRHKGEATVLSVLSKATRKAAKVAKVSVPVSLVAFAGIDIPVTYAASLFLSPEAAATSGAVAGAVVYAGAAKGRIDSLIAKQ